MTSLLERLVATIAPYYCIVCGTEDNRLCSICATDLFGNMPSTCFVCNLPTNDFAICNKCQATAWLDHVWVGAAYEGQVMQLIKQCKFERAVAVATALGKALATTLPCLPEKTIIVPVPTANQRVRQRGYDQAVLLSKAIAAETGYKVAKLLARVGSQRQVGATKRQRAAQLQQAFHAIGDTHYMSYSLLLVDDVLTTGATLHAAAQCLRAAGATSVNGAVVARHALAGEQRQ